MEWGFEMVIDDAYLMHYGIKRRSGRYPWGSGGNPYQRSGDFLSRVNELRSQNIHYKDENGKIWSGDAAVAKTMGMTTTDFRMQVRVANHERRGLEADRAKSLREDGKSLNEIAAIMGYKNDSSIRALLNENTSINKNHAKVTAEILKAEIDKKSMIDVGAGVERELGVSQNTLKEALFLLEVQGYHVYGIGIKQVNNAGKQTNTPILCKPDIEYKDVYQRMGEIKTVGDYHSTNNGTSFDKREYPASVKSDRVGIRYGDQGGTDKDGVIELRRGVEDLSLGKSHYAQVRILVDGTHYLKGMAIYSDDIPKGVDIVYNTNKKTGTSKQDVMKAIKKDDPDNPFGAYIKADGQSKYIDKNGNEKLSAINKLKEEGEWDTMARTLSSQFLSKQPVSLIKKQLGLTYSDKKSELEEICNLTNPTVKKKLLLDFANECDGAVVHLKAAALPRQSTQVILPITKIKETEIYAPNYKNGEKVALVRFPHGGTFEIPILTVNNKNKEARSILGRVMDAIGIHPKVAERLSGADYDGDTATVIPISSKVKITSTPALEGLKNFNAKDEYAYKEGMKVMPKSSIGKEMGMISNLITDMTLRGAKEHELVRAVKHSMVVIDAEKHKLDYKKSEKENGILELKKKYQAHTDDDGYGGASTLISKRKQELRVAERKGSGTIDADTGKVSYKETGRTYEEIKKVTNKTTGEVTYEKTGKIVPATTKVKLLNEVDDVHSLSSGTLQEKAYADYANNMKALANEARKEYKGTGNIVYSSTAKTTYQEEVNHLNAQLGLALMNAPRERQAQAIANSTIKAKVQSNNITDKNEIKKIGQQAIYDARATVGASGKENRITISDREWEAIQAGAITDSKLSQILRYADADEVRQRATPRTTSVMTSAKQDKLQAMANSGYTNSEIAEALGVSSSTVVKYLNGK